MAPVRHAFSPTIYHIGAEGDNTLIPLFCFENVVDAIAIGGESIGEFKFTLCNVQHKSVLLCIADGVVVQNKGDK